MLFSSLLLSVIPLSSAADTNLAPIFQYGTGQLDGCRWGQYDLFGFLAYASTNPADTIIFRDDSVTYNGHSSIRLEPKNLINPHREINLHWITTPPNTHIVFRAWVKTSSDLASGRAGIIGFDAFSSDGTRLVEVVPDLSGDDSVGFNYPKTWNYEWIPYNTDWTLVTIDVTVPSTYYSYTYKGAIVSPPKQIAGIQPFMSANWQEGESEADVWFADAELYINPTSLPSTPTPTPTSPPTGGGSSGGIIYPEVTPTPSNSVQDDIATTTSSTPLFLLGAVAILLFMSSNKKKGRR